jgi:hypothetical protein
MQVPDRRILLDRIGWAATRGLSSMVFDMLRKRKSSREDEQERRRIAVILDTALVQRSKLHIRFDQTVSNITGVSGVIIAMDGQAMVLEISGLASLTDRFLGQDIACFFRIVERDDRHREIFYSFTTKILRIRHAQTQTVQIAVTVPESLEGTQRRKSLRLMPDLQKFSHLAFWKYDASGGFDITKPTLSHSHFKNGLSLLDNLSAGGLRLTLRRAVIKEQGLVLQKGDRFIVFFTFAERLPKQLEEYWLVVKLNNIRLEPVSGDMTLGMEFIASGIRQAETGKIAWEKVADNVIDDLAQRIYQWHLALYREKGLM